MSARYRIDHRSVYEYDGSATASYNEARLTPQQTPWQLRLESKLTVDPVSWSHRYTDYWGTEVLAFEVNQQHRSLSVRATSVVEVDATRRPPPRALTWAELRTDEVRDRFVEFLAQRPATGPAVEIADLAESIAADYPPAQAAAQVSTTIHEAMTYMPGATAVHTTAAEAWIERRGVCQDYAHLVVGALRQAGVPARYVSGYLHPSAEPALGATARGESHAWVEYWLGDWQAYDPTNLAEVAERHVMVGSGRDYGDVPPIKGIVAGEHGAAALTVTVDLTRLA